MPKKTRRNITQQRFKVFLPHFRCAWCNGHNKVYMTNMTIVAARTGDPPEGLE